MKNPETVHRQIRREPKQMKNVIATNDTETPMGMFVQEENRIWRWMDERYIYAHFSIADRYLR
jgi:hypothetical protein